MPVSAVTASTIPASAQQQVAECEAKLDGLRGPMNVDVTTSSDIAAPVSTVAAFASEPDNAPRWYVNIKSVEWQTPRPIEVGSRFAFVAMFLGRRLEYVYQVVEYARDKRLVMRTADGPFPMETTYEWEPAETGTRMTLRNRGTPSGF